MRAVAYHQHSEGSLRQEQCIPVKIPQCLLQIQFHSGLRTVKILHPAFQGPQIGRSAPGRRGFGGLYQRPGPLPFSGHFSGFQKASVAGQAHSVFREFIFRGDDIAPEFAGGPFQVAVVFTVFVGAGGVDQDASCLRAGKASASMRFWRAAQMSGSCGLHSATARGSLRNIPSPLQGTSATITS